jgi:hypothetical protein
LAIEHIHKQACNQYKHTNLSAELEEGINGKRRNIYIYDLWGIGEWFSGHNPGKGVAKFGINLE